MYCAPAHQTLINPCALLNMCKLNIAIVKLGLNIYTGLSMLYIYYFFTFYCAAWNHSFRRDCVDSYIRWSSDVSLKCTALVGKRRQLITCFYFYTYFTHIYSVRISQIV